MAYVFDISSPQFIFETQNISNYESEISKLQIHKSIIRPTVTYCCETWAMTVTEQNRLLVFERRVLRKIYGPTLDNDGTWRIKTNEELEILI